MECSALSLTYIWTHTIYTHMGTLTSGLYTKCGWPNLGGKAFHLIRWPQIYLYVLLSSDTVVSSDSGACWTLIARLCERKGTKSERLVQSFKTGRGLGKEVQEEVLEKGKHSEVGGLDCRKRRRGGVQCEIQSTRQHCRDHLPREEPMMDNLSRGSTTPSGKMLSSLQPTLPQEQAGYQRDLKKRVPCTRKCHKLCSPMVLPAVHSQATTATRPRRYIPAFFYCNTLLEMRFSFCQFSLLYLENVQMFNKNILNAERPTGCNTCRDCRLLPCTSEDLVHYAILLILLEELLYDMLLK